MDWIKPLNNAYLPLTRLTRACVHAQTCIKSPLCSPGNSPASCDRARDSPDIGVPVRACWVSLPAVSRAHRSDWGAHTACLASHCLAALFLLRGMGTAVRLLGRPRVKMVIWRFLPSMLLGLGFLLDCWLGLGLCLVSRRFLTCSKGSFYVSAMAKNSSLSIHTTTSTVLKSLFPTQTLGW